MKCSCRLGLSVLAVCLVTAYQHGYQGGVLNEPSLLFEVFVEFDKSPQIPGNKSMYGFWHNYVGSGFTNFQRYVHFIVKHESILFPATVAMFPLGAILGSAMTVLWLNICDCGHINVIHYSLFIIAFGIISETLCTIAGTKSLLMFGRFLIGVGVGLCDGVAPLYLAEIGPPETRTTLVTSYQFFITFGMIMGQVGGCVSISPFQTVVMFHQDDDFSIGILSSSLFFVLLLWLTMGLCEESPRYYLMTRKDEVRAKNALIWLRNNDDIEDELEEMNEENKSIQQSKVTLADLVKDPSFRCCLIIVMIEQLCGVSVLIYYSTEILMFMGYQNFANVGALLVTLSMLIGAIISMILASLEVNRRALLLASLGGMFFFTLIMFLDFLLKEFGDIDSYCWIPMLWFALFYAIGVGPARWLIITEMFDYSARPLVVSLIQSLTFLLDFLIAIIFGAIKRDHGYEMFVIFAFFDAGAFWYVLMRMPKAT